MSEKVLDQLPHIGGVKLAGWDGFNSYIVHMCAPLGVHFPGTSWSHPSTLFWFGDHQRTTLQVSIA